MQGNYYFLIISGGYRYLSVFFFNLSVSVLKNYRSALASNTRAISTKLLQFVSMIDHKHSTCSPLVLSYYILMTII